MSVLDGKVVMITGAKGGLGTSVTTSFLQAGATVAGVSRSIKDTDFPNPKFVALPAELTNSDEARVLVGSLVSRLGRLDAVVHLVGGFAGGNPVQDTGDDVLDKMLDLNLRSAFYVCRAAIPELRRNGNGKILAVASRAAVQASPGAAAYAASKAALVALVRAIAAENVDRALSANVVLPGTMDTPANRAADPRADFSRWVQPSKVAEVLVSLTSDAWSQVTGAAIPIYGGES